MKIRKATKKDAGTLSALNAEAQKIHADAFPEIFKQPENDSFAIQFVLEKLDVPGNYYCIANINGEDVGYVYAKIIDMPENPFMFQWKFIHIDQITIKKKYQRMGCGEKLIAEINNLAKDKGIKTITLDTWLFNEQAQSFFKKQGFIPFQNRKWKTWNL
jgi:diamine N-acetyltransferase